MNKWYKVFYRVIVFGLIVCIGLSYLSKVFFTYGETYTEIRGFYAEPENSLDVLFLGSSSCVRGISSMKMWDEYGFTSYSRATTQQAPVVTYEMLKDALKYQQPKVVVLFCEWLWDEYDYVNLEGNIRPAVDGMKMSWEKWNLMNYIYSKDERQTKLSYIFPFFRYHDRWNELEIDDFKIDFMPVTSYKKGQRPMYNVADIDEELSKEVIVENDTVNDESFTEAVVENDVNVINFSEEAVNYYQKTINLCKENDIDVVIVKGYKQNYWPITYSKMLEEFAEQNDCPFLDYNYGEFANELTIEWPNDYCDKGHLNYYGSLKFSTHLGGFLSETYDLPDKREDVNYQKWNEDLEYYYIQNLRADITLVDNKIQCKIIGYDDIGNLNFSFQYRLYKDDEQIFETETMLQDEYTYEISESGIYKLKVYVYDGEKIINEFYGLSEIEFLME